MARSLRARLQPVLELRAMADVFGIKGKIALVTGSTLGIGFATAVALARHGASVIVNGRGDKNTNQAVAKLKSVVPGASVKGVACDLSTADGVAYILKQVPVVDILVNNLGIFAPQDFMEIPDSEWIRFFEVNVMSGVRLTRAYLPAMLKKDWGRVIFVSSESGVNIPTEMIHYGTTKSAQIAIASALAAYTRGTGVTVNSVLPGPTRSEGVDDFLKDIAKKKKISVEQVEKDFFKETRPQSLIGRFLTVDEVANMILYASSGLSSGTTGAPLRVEGGCLRSML